MTITDSLGFKVVAVLVGLGLAFSLFAFAPSANAQTVEELQAQITNLLATITALQAQLTALQGGSTATPGFTFTRDLSEGSTGEDVRQLQIRLNAESDIQVAVSGAGSPGQETTFFGPLTRAAVVAYQNKYAASILTPVGLTSGTGYVGPSTRAHLNATAPVAPAPDDTTGDDTDDTTTTTTGAGTEGSLTVTLEAFPSNGTDVEKGETENVAAIEIEADDSDMTINRLDVNFDVRPWLYVDELAILDGSTVVRELTGLSSSDFTEITEGTDYRLRATGLDISIPGGTNKVLTIRVHAIANTDKTAKTITITFKANSVRGTDTSGLTHEEPAAALTGRTFDFKADTTGNVEATLDANSPVERNVVVTNTGTTENVEIMRFQIEAEHSQIDVNKLQFSLALNTTTIASFATLFDEIWLADSSGNKIASASTVASTTIFSTSDLDGLDQMVVPVGTKSSYRLMVTAADADDYGNGIAASSTLTSNATNIVAEDDDFDTVTVTSTTVTGSNVHFYQAAPDITDKSATASIVGDDSYLANVEMKFTMTALGGDIYVSKTPAVMLATSTTASDTVSATGLTSVVASGSTSGDSSTEYKIGAGASRTFTFSGSVNNLNGTAGTKEFKITKINWGTASGSLTTFNTDFELESLEVNPSLTGT